MINVKELRTRLEVTQSQFADAVGVSPALVQSWELGRRVPNPMAQRMLILLARQPALVTELRKIGEGVIWSEENKEAIAHLNKLGDEHGSFAEQYRTF